VAVKSVVRYPARVLKGLAGPVGEIGPRERALADDLVDTMYDSPGCVGLAAPQLGVPLRAFCLDVSVMRKPPEGNHGLVVLFDPELVLTDGSELKREGCMSVPDYTCDRRRTTLGGVRPAPYTSRASDARRRTAPGRSDTSRPVRPSITERSSSGPGHPALADPDRGRRRARRRGRARWRPAACSSCTGWSAGPPAAGARHPRRDRGQPQVPGHQGAGAEEAAALDAAGHGALLRLLGVPGHPDHGPRGRARADRPQHGTSPSSTPSRSPGSPPTTSWASPRTRS
jgi:hypothetical protein